MRTRKRFSNGKKRTLIRRAERAAKMAIQGRA